MYIILYLTRTMGKEDSNIQCIYVYYTIFNQKRKEDSNIQE